MRMKIVDFGTKDKSSGCYACYIDSLEDSFVAVLFFNSEKPRSEAADEG